MKQLQQKRKHEEAMAYNIGIHVPRTNKTPAINGTQKIPKSSVNPLHAHGTPITRSFSGAHRLNPMGNHK